MTIPAERFAFSYADGAHNAESLILDAATGAVFIVTKEAAGARSAAYRLESFEPGQVNRAVKVADLAVPVAGDQPATSGTGHPCAPGLLLRTNNRLYELRAAAGAPFADAFRAAATCCRSATSCRARRSASAPTAAPTTPPARAPTRPSTRSAASRRRRQRQVPDDLNDRSLADHLEKVAKKKPPTRRNFVAPCRNEPVPHSGTRTDGPSDHSNRRRL